MHMHMPRDDSVCPCVCAFLLADCDDDGKADHVCNDPDEFGYISSATFEDNDDWRDQICKDTWDKPFDDTWMKAKSLSDCKKLSPVTQLTADWVLKADDQSEVDQIEHTPTEKTESCPTPKKSWCSHGSGESKAILVTDMDCDGDGIEDYMCIDGYYRTGFGFYPSSTKTGGKCQDTWKNYYDLDEFKKDVGKCTADTVQPHKLKSPAVPMEKPGERCVKNLCSALDEWTSFMGSAYLTDLGFKGGDFNCPQTPPPPPPKPLSG